MRNQPRIPLMFIDDMSERKTVSSHIQSMITKRFNNYYTNLKKTKPMTETTTSKVADFHELFEHPIGNIHELEPLAIRQLRIKLLFEELQELAEAGDVRKTFFDLCEKGISQYSFPFNNDGNFVKKVEELDAITDIQYVLDGKKITSGLYKVTDRAFDLVHENNMNKAHRSAEHAQATIQQLLTSTPEETYSAHKQGDYWLVKRGDGKLIKPWDHKKVNLSPLLTKTI